jgi:hypothetical protein
VELFIKAVFLNLREEYRSKELENNLLRETSGCERDNVSGRYVC